MGPGSLMRHFTIQRLFTALADIRAALRGMVSQVRASTDSISTASAEIATGNQNLSEITGTVRQSADSARQADQLASSALVEQSTAAAEILKEQAAQLARAVGSFRLGDTPAIGRAEPALVLAASAMPAAGPARAPGTPSVPVRPLPPAAVAASAIASAAASAAAVPARTTPMPPAAAKPALAKANKTGAVTPEPPKAASANDDGWETF